MKLFPAIFIAFVAPALTHAAAFTLEPSRLHPGEPVLVSVFVDESLEFNAIEGEIAIPENIRITDVREGNSIVSFWLDRPSPDRIVKFTGLIPGGFSGKGKLFDAVLEVGGEEEYMLPTRIKLYANDGQGTLLPAFEGSLKVHGDGSAHAPTSTKDLEPPESFLPAISRDPNMFDGQYFVVFDTADKLSGLDHFEVLEVPVLSLGWKAEGWQRAESPYVLKDQSRRSDLYIRAVDRAGNFRIVKMPASSGNQQIIYVTLFLVLICLVVMWRAYRHYRHEP